MATGSASAMPMRPADRSSSAMPCLIDSIFFAPTPLSPSSLPLAIASVSPAVLVMPRSFHISAIVLGPSPGMSSMGISPAGTLAVSSS